MDVYSNIDNMSLGKNQILAVAVIAIIIVAAVGVFTGLPHPF